MVPNWKIPAVSGGAAFLLSFLIGLASSVNAGAVVVRALLGGIVFAALALGIQYLWSRFFSDLEVPQDELEEEGAGTQVNIVVDDEGLEDRGTDQVSEREISSDAQISVPQDESLEPEGDVESESGTEPEEGVIPESNSDGLPENGGVPSKVESAGALPDLEQFSDSFRSVAEDFIDDSESSAPTPQKRGPSVDVMGQEHSTEDIARAVQTIIKKDQKG